MRREGGGMGGEGDARTIMLSLLVIHSGLQAIQVTEPHVIEEGRGTR